MLAQTFVVAVHPYGERYRAVVVAVNAARAADVEQRLADSGYDPNHASGHEILLAVAVRPTARDAVRHVVEKACGDIADELGV